ncbi:MAG TPA: ATP-dependent DNA helicase RecG [Phycisphaeraceae bacterium]
MPEPAVHDSAPLRLASPVTELPGVGAQRARLLKRLGIQTLSDLIRHLPMRYQYESAEDAIGRLQVGLVGSARGMVAASRWVTPLGRGRRGRLEATLEDATGRLRLTWFNAPYLRDRIVPGLTIRVQGKVTAFGGYPQMVNPRWEPLEDPEAVPAQEERLRPIYPATEDLPSAVLERLIAQALPLALPRVIDPLPADFVQRHAMPDLASAYQMAHQPRTMDQAQAARRRLAYNELLLLQLGIAVKRAYVEHHLTAPALKHNEAIHQHILARFPFPLTPWQEQVVQEIAQDLARPRPMNRLLQGDVGSGKTAVALYALLVAVANNKQGALMAPTELLAEQHFGSIGRMLEGSQVRLALLTGTQPPANSAARAALLERIATGQVDLVVGTHALLTESVRFGDLAVVVIDEQHRFGVQQRAAFRMDGKAGAEEQDRRRVPHHLVMTATPIPRTLSLTLFGDLEVSTIRQSPPGRKPVVSRLVSPEKADEVYRYIRTRLERGEQAYVVVPAIDPAGHETAAQLKTVREHAKLLQDKFYHGFNVAAVHGRLKRQTRERIMDRFRRGLIHVLVATTVIEVGVDVPNATVMVIEHAERFGLAQLHQLRGRVGRGGGGPTSLCVFIAEPATEEAQQRLHAIVSTSDGFKIAEMDLEIRGMGEFFGTRQHGLPPLRVAQVPQDMDLLMLARRDAQQIIQDDPSLNDPAHQNLRRVLLQQYGQSLGLIDVG